jgi:hypothetical protein
VIPASNELVLRAIDALESLHIPYMLVGSFSSNAYGVARSTQDADFVIELGEGSIVPLVNRLAPDLVMDAQMSFESVTMTSRFLAKNAATGFKIEFFLVAPDSFDQSRFLRRQQQPFLDRMIWLPTQEDVVIQKLRRHSLAKRTKDLEDARNVVAVRLKHLDLEYLRKWCNEHGTRHQLETLLTEAEQLG